MATTYVTQDVYDHVLDSLAGDKSSLASCALVCRDWRSRSQYHFFADITLTIHSDRVSDRQKGFEDVLRGHPHVASYVRSLTIRAIQQRHDHLPVSWPGGFPVDFSRFPNLRALTLCDFLFVSPLDFLPIIRSIPLLEELSLERVWLPNRRRTPEQLLPLKESLARADLSPIRPLKALRFKHYDIRTSFTEDQCELLATALLRTGALAKLTTLELLSNSPGFYGWFPSLPKIGQRLTHFALCVPDVSNSMASPGLADMLRTYSSRPLRRSILTELYPLFSFLAR